MYTYVLVVIFPFLVLVIKNTSSLSATQVLQRQRSALLAASPLVATKGASTPRAATVMMSPKLGRGLVGCDDTVDLSEDVKLSKQKVCGWGCDANIDGRWGGRLAGAMAVCTRSVQYLCSHHPAAIED